MLHTLLVAMHHIEHGAAYRQAEHLGLAGGIPRITIARHLVEANMLVLKGNGLTVAEMIPQVNDGIGPYGSNRPAHQAEG